MPVSTIIPAFNEEKTIGNMVRTLKGIDIIDEIIVVSDGSWDNTALIAKEYGALIIELPENIGKGGALKKGLEVCNNDIILFLDADLIGLKEVHVRELVEPIISDQYDMTIGLFEKGRASTDLAQKIAPRLSGQRGVRKWIIANLQDMEITGYGIEVTLNKYAKKEKIRVLEVKLSNLTHVMKEEKYGVKEGFNERLRMYWQICKSLKPSNKFKLKYIKR